MTISPLVAEFLDKTVALPAKITQRDLDVLQLLTEGMEPKQIAAHIGVKYGVINRTMNRLQRIYNVQSALQLAAIAHQILKVRKPLD
jgi:DNA-binding CsgD family transcriptional regulator